jgi:hypothetical protein
MIWLYVFRINDKKKKIDCISFVNFSLIEEQSKREKKQVDQIEKQRNKKASAKKKDMLCDKDHRLSRCLSRVMVRSGRRWDGGVS